MPHDPAISSDDLRQDFEITRHFRGDRVAISTYVRRRRIDAARRYSRHARAANALPQSSDPSPVNSLISEERTKLIRESLRLATPLQQKIADLMMNGHRRCDIAAQLGVSRSSVTHILQRLRPLLAKVR